MIQIMDIAAICRNVFPSWKVAILKEVDGGRSDARVAVVDFVSGDATAEMPQPQGLTSGQYILKVQPHAPWPGEEPESSRHEVAVNRSAQFSKDHIPRLRFSTERDSLAVLLYDIAGYSLSGFVGADAVDVGSLIHYCGLISGGILRSWNAQYTVNNLSTAGATLAAWLGYRLNRNKAPNLHTFVSRLTGDRPIFLMAGRVLVNPLWLAAANEINIPISEVSFNGLIHGDLHSGNILVDRMRPDLDRYWLIDFALSREAPLGFDHSYFELALLLGHLEGADAQRMLNILEALDAPDGSPDARKVPVQDLGILACVASIRGVLREWQITHESTRTDSFHSQVMLSRVAVGLNWVNKPISESLRRLALAYAARAATRYLEVFADQSFQRLVASAGPSPDALPAPVSPAWPDVWDQLGRFDSTRAKYVLVTGRVEPSEAARSLALVPWSLVIDLDPESNESGLHSCIGSTLSRLRSVNQYGCQPIDLDLDRGTAWMMANGWPSRFEPVPESFRRWRAAYGDGLRNISDEMRRVAAPLPVKVLVLAGLDVEPNYLRSAIAMIDEALNDSSDITVVGPTSLQGEPGIKAEYSLPVADFLTALHQVLGGTVQIDEPTIPGAHGFVQIPLDQLRNLNEDIEILHSRVLEDQEFDATVDSFWRGNPPSWLDLHADLDVRRELGPRLLARSRDLLEARGNYTIEFHHTPGSGGTTAALRCAWDLRRDFPVAVLRRYSPTTADRIDQLSRLTQKPVLLVAEGVLLPQAQREDLYREIALRNVRCVILYVVRSFDDVESTDKERFRLSDPMTDGEADAFLRAFSLRTDNPKRRLALQQLTISAQLEPYRTPFYYGLTAFEKDFERVDHYVAAHLARFAPEVRTVMRYLALVTRYTQIGTSLGFLKSLLDLAPDSDIELPEALGESAAKLVIRQGQSVRLLHPIVAEELLIQELGGNESWSHGLKDLSLDLINAAVNRLGPDTVECMQLLTGLFIKREFWTSEMRARRNFSELLLTIPSAAGQHQVLKTLTNVCPQEPHFWNHLGRHHIYEMKQDFQAAEAYLQKAVELDPNDKIHHHALGMVRRFWIRSQIADALRETTLRTPEELFSSIIPLLDGAADEFAAARRLAPDNDHGYITQVQLIVEVLEGLSQLGEGENLSNLMQKQNALGRWVRRSVVVAEDLLRQVQHLRQQRVPSKYELRCVNGLATLYGHFEALVSSLEELASTVEDPDVRRALAVAYYSRSGRVWKNLSEFELRRTREMMEDNLRSDPTNERDIRAWFQSFRRLPDFSYIDAIDRLEGWASTSGAVDAYYYLYILHFLRWKGGAERDDSAMQASLENCKQRTIGKRGLSYEWFAKEPTWCPLTHVSELGERRKDPEGDEDFFENTETLTRVRGKIDSIKGPQAGLLRLGPRTTAFFLPGKKFSESRHLNSIVEFYVGFSYEGLRAWVADFVAEGVTTETRKKTTDPAKATPIPMVSSGQVSIQKAEMDEKPLHARVHSFIRDQLVNAENCGKILFVSSLGVLLQSHFGSPPIHQRLGASNLEDLLASLPFARLARNGILSTVALAPEGSPDARARKKVPPVGDGEGRQGTREEMRAAEEIVLRALSESERRRSTFLLSVAGGLLLDYFKVPQFYRQFGFAKLRDFINGMDAVCVDSTGLLVVRRTSSTGRPS
jgi:tetratricopeptide (TPR) repeat protein